MSVRISESTCREDLTNAVVHVLGLLKMMELNLGFPLDRLSPQDVAAVKLAYSFARHWSDVATTELAEEEGSRRQLEAMFMALAYLADEAN